MISLIVSVVFCIIIGIVFWRLKILKRAYLEPLFMWIMIFGIFALCQPWAFILYRFGYAILLTGTAGYIFSIHVK
ncbi:MAG: hypothetical protein FJW61_00580 [Actinobacteria bacterium]|nr:hypothetical protein [Actinomycetota bacterium]